MVDGLNWCVLGFDGGTSYGVSFELATVLGVYCQFANALFVRGLYQ